MDKSKKNKTSEQENKKKETDIITVQFTRKQLIFFMDCFLLMNKVYENNNTINIMLKNMKYKKMSKKIENFLDKSL